MTKLRAIHVVSTAPFFAKNKGDFAYEDFDLYNMALSALMWRKLNGEIELLTDNHGAEYFEKIGVVSLWNNVRTVIPNDLEGINPYMFWAAGKLLALREVEAPVVMIDTDFIVWKRLDFGKNVIAAHRENISDGIYPYPACFKMNRNYRFPVDINSAALPLNTAFLYLPDEDFKQFYVNQAIGFMKCAENCDDYLRYMVFAEQRLLAMLTEKLNIGVDTLLDKDALFFPQDSFTHLWGAKQVMRDNQAERERFCERCRERILHDFPEYASLILAIDNTAK